MRTERKFVIDPSEENPIRFFLLSNRCKEIYSERLVSSIYYDTPSKNLYFDSIDGVSNRHKIRIRFYDLDPKKSQIEIKNKYAELNSKTYLDINNIPQGESLQVKTNNRLNFKSYLTIPSKIDSIYFPTSFVSYSRRYYLCEVSQTRFTIDSEIIFAKIYNKKNHILIGHSKPYLKSVLEIKNDENTIQNLYLIREITNNFNLIYSRSSKYCESISFAY